MFIAIGMDASIGTLVGVAFSEAGAQAKRVSEKITVKKTIRIGFKGLSFVIVFTNHSILFPYAYK